MVESVRVKDFRPSVDGFHFQNSWPHEPDLTLPFPTGPLKIGDAANGLCGGMAYAVRDYFEAGQPIPADTDNPPLHSPLYNYIVRRLFDSFDIPSGVAEYLTWQLPTRNQFKDTVKDEWPKIRHNLDSGQLVALGLIRTRSFWPGELGKNHQVLTYGYDVDDAQRVTLLICDPNHANADDVTLTFSAGNPNGHADLAYVVSGQPVSSHSEERTYGCFVTTYSHVTPPDLTSPALTAPGSA
jgi:hypothetical protein